jgi:alkyldihydroxyacetonephosphate synthase
VKSAIQQTFVDGGATLSHHHAVGTEHAPWLEQDISPAGVAMVRALLEGVDPGQNLNPGKIVGVPVRVDEAGRSPHVSPAER